MKNLLLTLFLTLVASLAISQIARADDAKPAAPGGDKKSGAQLVNADDAEKLIADKKVVVLDVRTPEEYSHGHIQGATNLNINGKDFKTKVAELDKKQPYLVHCAVGMRSARACKAMDDLGFKTLYDLKGGLDAWKKAGKPLVKEKTD